MRIIDRFESFAADFEHALQDDNWSRLEKYFTEDATYLNVGGPDPTSVGRQNVIDYLKKDVSDFDRHFDQRTLVALTPPTVEGCRLSRRWRCTYSLDGAPDLVVEGDARYLFEENLIKEIEEEATPDSMQRVDKWMQEYAEKLHI